MSADLSREVVRDKWILASAMQKCIRRADVDGACSFAIDLARINPAMAWRRLTVAAFEDIGAANPDIGLELIAAPACKARLAGRSADLEHLQNSVAALSLASKDRSADHLLSLITCAEVLDLCPGYGSLPRWVKLLVDTCRMVDPPSGYWNVSALNTLAGHLAVNPPNDSSLPSAFEAARLFRSPFPLFVPVVATHLGAFEVRCHRWDSRRVGGIPLFAFGWHTRIGRRAIRQFAKQEGSLAEFRRRSESSTDFGNAVGNCVFCVESALTSPAAEWPLGQELESVAMQAELISNGIDPNECGDLLDLVRRALPHLDQIRLDLLSQNNEPGSVQQELDLDEWRPAL